jgi:Domain of unknown function (DUF4062)
MRVFLSSTFQDLREERRSAADAIVRSGFQPVLIEDEAAGENISTTVKRLIDEADIFLLIVGDRYGTRAPGEANSWIQTEYEIAKSDRKPILTFAKTSGAVSGDRHEALERARFLASVERERLIVRFNSPEELGNQITSVLTSFRAESGDRTPEEKDEALQRMVALHLELPPEMFNMVFAPELSADQVKATLAALADYYRACGGVGLQMDFEIADVLVEEPIDVLA